MSKNNEHIDSAAFKKYLSDKTPSSEKVTFEQSIEEGSFEEEALEGFNSLENDSAALAAITAIDKEVAKRTGRKAENKSIFPIWKVMSIAASVVLFLGVGFFINESMKNETNLALNDKDSKDDSVELMEDEIRLEGNEQSLDFNDLDSNSFRITEELEADEVLLNEPKEQMPPPPPPSIEVEEDEPEIIKAIEVADFDDDSYEYEESEDVVADYYVPVSTTTANQIKQESDSEISRESSSKKVANNVPSSADLGSSIENNSYLNIAKANYSSGNYGTAINYFQNSIESGEKVAESNYFIGLSYYNLNKNVKALKYLDNVLATNSSWVSSAKWYKILIYEERGDDNNAKRLLEDLSNGNSAFKSQAADKLKAY